MTNLMQALKNAFDGAVVTALTQYADRLRASFETKVSDMDERMHEDVLLYYPVGAIYMSTVSTSPADLFGGSWERIRDRFLLGGGDEYAVGRTGGAATHTLTVEELTSHTHGNGGGTAYGGANSFAKGTGANNAMIVDTSTGEINAYAELDSTGGGQAHNNMPPYLTVYMWQRTA